MKFLTLLSLKFEPEESVQLTENIIPEDVLLEDVLEMSEVITEQESLKKDFNRIGNTEKKN